MFSGVNLSVLTYIFLYFKKYFLFFLIEFLIKKEPKPLPCCLLSIPIISNSLKLRNFFSLFCEIKIKKTTLK